MNSYKKFTRLYLGLTLLFCSIIIAFNWLINPYDIYQSPTFKGFNKNKPLVVSHLRLAKAKAVEWQKPDYLIMGSSTAETGLNPEHPGFQRQKVYNLGLSGANIYEVKRYLEHAEATHPAKKIILALNFFMFNAYLNNRNDFDESILNVDREGKTNYFTGRGLVSLLTFDAIHDSIITLREQHKENAFRSNGQLRLNYRAAQINELKGYKNNFLYVEGFNKSNYLPAPARRFGFQSSNNEINTLGYLQEIIDLCQNKNTELILVLAPVHVRLLESYKLLGLSDEYDKWQTAITALIEEHNRKFPASPFTLWGFNKVNAITTEKLPPKDDVQSAMQWFWDPEHFKNRLGNLILSQILNATGPDIEDFSVQLTLKNIDNELQKNRLALEQWENEHQRQVKQLKMALDQTKA